jgi:hypothetical protein
LNIVEKREEEQSDFVDAFREVMAKITTDYLFEIWDQLTIRRIVVTIEAFLQEYKRDNRFFSYKLDTSKFNLTEKKIFVDYSEFIPNSKNYVGYKTIELNF